MSLLLYCVTLEQAPESTHSGVGGALVHSKIESGFRFFFSEALGRSNSSSDLVSAAQQVHAVVTDIFSRSPLLPFRYPTIVAGETELTQVVSACGEAFRQYFARVGNNVQMDIRLTLSAPEDQRVPELSGPSVGMIAPVTGGRAYLEARAHCQALLLDAAETCRLAAHSADWRIQQRGENIRCQALIPRVEVLSFLERMRTLELPVGVKAAVSGPWPPAGFWEDEPR